MAGYDLIDTYLTGLKSRMSWHRRRDDVDSELRDHLYSAVEDLEQRGIDAQRAQQQVLDRFGESGLVATAFASTGSRGLALPTSSTKDAGKLAIVAAVLWIVFAGGMTATFVVEEVTGEWEGGAQLLFIFATGVLLGAAALTVFVLVGLQARHGGLGILGSVGIGLTALGTIASFVSWFVYGWAGLIGAGTALLGAAMLRRGLAPTVPTLLFGGGWATAWVLGASLLALEVGPQDEWGDYPLATVTMIMTGSLIVAAGLAGLGRWLAAEQPEPEPAVVLP